MRKKTTDEFIQNAKMVHGNKYDYSLVDYKNNSTKVEIICPKHGIFKQTPANHLWGKGCPRCASEKLKKPIYGSYYNDYRGSIWDNDKKVMIQSYISWRAMVTRCEDEKYQNKYPTYTGCEICKEWHLYSNFKKWFDKNYVKGWALDKDLLSDGKKIYSPDTCCFLPVEINSALTYKKSNRGNSLLGVCKTQYGKYTSDFSKKYLGTSDSEIEMFYRYKKAKENDFKELAEKYKKDLDIRAYNRLYNLKINIDD